MFVLNRNIWVLMLAGSLGMCVAPLIVFIGGIVGTDLAPTPDLATLPVAALVVGTALAVVPVSRAMQLWGRKKVFLINAFYAAAASGLAAVAVELANFWLFCFAVVLLGGSLAVVQQFRFAAMESVDPALAANAASLVLLGGLIAAFLGPELAHIGQNIFQARFLGSFGLLALASLASAVVLLFYRQNELPQAQQNTRPGGRPLGEIVRQPVLWAAVMSAGIGYAVMSYVMTATPVSMHHVQGHSLLDTKWVIQSHICAMFLPSFFSGLLISRFGAKKMMLVGLLVYVLCGLIALSGQALMHYWLGLVLLGVGWNFLFVAGTALLPDSYVAEERFKVQGLNDFTVFVCQAIASLSSGVVIFNFGWNAMILFASPMLILLMFVLWRWHRSDVAVG